MSGLKVERAQADDLAALLELVERKPYPGSRIAGIDAELRRQSDVQALRAGWQGLLDNPQVAILWVRNRAYCIAGLGQVDFATGQVETVVVEHAGELSCYPALLNEIAGLGEDGFLAIRLYPEQPELRECLASCGFAPEFTRVVRGVQGNEVQNLVGQGVRRAGPADRPFLAKLHIQCSPFYESSNRQDAEWGALSALENYLSLDFSGDLLGWVAEEEGQSVGYVLLRKDFGLDMLSRQGAYLYDIAVSTQHWGRQLVVGLHERAVAEVAQMGYLTVVGDISAHNQRALRVALEKLGYQVEWERWGRNL